MIVSRIGTALVIGGGLAGPATAMALAKAGIEPTVYEARGEARRCAAAGSTSPATGWTRWRPSMRWTPRRDWAAAG